ncbi:MAG: GAF domain-containing protein [Candidatus Margulisbacteria bacterium]|jgi:signal transduction histidine kinase|nr:GAF domain-containing protein [Candidatus Margulisiibacteriota bacterium]
MVNQKLRTFSEISQIIISTLNTREIYNNIVKLIAEAVGVDRAIFFIDQNDTLVSVAVHGAPAQGVLGRALDKNTSVFGRLYRDGRPRLLRATRQTDLVRMLGAAQYYTVPVQTRDKTLGILAVDNVPSGRPLADLDEELLEALAGQLAVAIENAARVAELARLNRELAANTIISDIMHQIKNPLTPLKMFAQLAEMYPDKQKFWAEHGSVIKEEIQNLENNVQAILSFTRRAEFKIQPLDLADVVQKVLSLVKVQAQNAAVRIIVNIAGGLRVLADLPAFQQALLNLLLNAIEAMPPERKGKIEISARLAEDRAAAVITIRDNGCGVSKNNLKKIFTRRFTTKAKGNGLGLADVHRIIEEHKGSITVQSKLNKGTVFTIEMPSAAEKI